jgi:hypothetical protein
MMAMTSDRRISGELVIPMSLIVAKWSFSPFDCAVDQVSICLLILKKTF